MDMCRVGTVTPANTETGSHYYNITNYSVTLLDVYLVLDAVIPYCNTVFQLHNVTQFKLTDTNIQYNWFLCNY